MATLVGRKSIIQVSVGEDTPTELVDERSDNQIMSDFLAWRGLPLDQRADRIREQGLKILKEGVDD
jgi:hypothetical protein